MTERTLSLVLALWLLPLSSTASEELFEKNVRPVLVAKCGSCHNPKVKTGGLDLTTPEGMRQADADVGLLHAAEPSRSRLLSVLRWEEKVKMPPSGQLPPGEISAIEQWIREGAVLPAANLAQSSGLRQPHQGIKGRDHWSFQPVSQTPSPRVASPRIRNDIDRYIFEKLRGAGIDLPPEADKLTLLRRAKFDLHGLPPTDEEIRSFSNDTSADAYEKLIERLLASPRYGEKWGRHWMDVARFAETGGIDENVSYREGWRYREYVIDALNRDVPFNRFIVEQLAGDVLLRDSDYIRGRIATGFLALGPKAIVEQDKTKQLYDVIDEQIDTTSKAFLGLTISCARCHDHKFDPISAEDYYALASIFRSTRLYDTLEGRSSTLYFAPLVGEEEYARYQSSQDEIAARKLEIEALIEPEITDYLYREQLPKLADYMAASWAVEQKGASLEAITRDRGLDPKILEKLSKYLKADGSFRPFLAKWHAVSERDVPTVAAEYAAMIRQPSERWREILSKWAAGVKAARAAGRKPPPKVRFEGFAFSEESERFFGDIFFLANTFNERDRQDGAFAIPEKERRNFLSDSSKLRASKLQKELDELSKTAPKKPLVAHGVAEDEPFDQQVFIRGSHTNLGKPVAKRFPVVLAGEDQPPVKTTSGRLELAQWIGSAKNPLTARVAANRIWLWHFGEGLVRTPDNFGLRGETPTHPELLDYLARTFVEQGWSFKQMHRLIMNSATYRFSSGVSDAAWEKDPGNHLWSRFNRRRLLVEEIRDSWLAVGGTLDLRMGSYLDPVEGMRMDARRGRTKMDEHFRRTLYLPVDRNSLASMMVLFDFADSTTSTGQRGETYISPQALFLMNNQFFQDRAVAFAKSLRSDAELTDRQRIEMAGWKAWGRPLGAEEIEQMTRFVAGYPKSTVGEKPSDPWVALGRLFLLSNNFFYID